MALTDVQKLRIEVQDTSLEFPLLSDDEYQYILDKNNQSIRKASLDAARVILFKLSIESVDNVVSVFSIKGSQAARAYMDALKMFINNQALNPIAFDGTVYAGGISKSDYEANNLNPDNIIPSIIPSIVPSIVPSIGSTNSSNNPFLL